MAMYLYIAIAGWLGVNWYCYIDGGRRLPTLSLIAGLIILYFIYGEGVGNLGMAALAVLTVLTYLASLLRKASKG